MILLDTCTLLWLVSGSPRLSETARTMLGEARGLLFVSAISALEIGLKARKGKIELPLPPERWYGEACRLHGLREVPVNGTVALRSAALPPLHADPADRILVATAQVAGLTLLTPDPRIAAYPDLRVAW